jgi:hypothetical protein
MPRSIACFLGAGFSYLSGVPLARELFDASAIATSESSWNRFAAVREHYDTWRKDHPDQHSEQYMGDILNKNAGRNAPKWSWVVEYVCAVIATTGTPASSKNRNLRYSNRVTRPYPCEAHREFWSTIFGLTKDVSVITTNYDIMVERVLRHRLMQRPPSLGCFYGGLPRPQRLTGVTEPFSRWSPDRDIEMSGTVPVFKLHGSLNWTLNGDTIVAYQDMRPVFRHGGTAAIVAPVPEKSAPPWLANVWSGAAECLRRSDVWVICGYSLPLYDIEVCNLLRDAGRGRCPILYLLSPNSASLRARYVDIVPHAKIVCLPGLPIGTAQLAAHCSLARSPRGCLSGVSEQQNPDGTISESSPSIHYPPSGLPAETRDSSRLKGLR